MNRPLRGSVLILSFVLLAGLFASAQQEGTGALSAEALKKVVPATYFFRGQSAPVQLRNSAGFRTADEARASGPRGHQRLCLRRCAKISRLSDYRREAQY